MGKALEILFSKYHKIEERGSIEIDDNIDLNELIERKRDEKSALESIYDRDFEERIKDQIWTIKLKLDYLTEDDKIKVKKQLKKPEKRKEICKMYLLKKCRFGLKCKFLHQQPDVEEKPLAAEDSIFTLEIRFSEGI